MNQPLRGVTGFLETELRTESDVRWGERPPANHLGTPIPFLKEGK